MNKEKSKKKPIIIALIILAIVVCAVAFAVTKCSSKSGKSASGGDAQSESSTDPIESIINQYEGDLVPVVEENEDLVDPGEGKLDVSKIKGISNVTINKERNNISSDENADFKEENLYLNDTNLTLDSVCSYFGSFVEDGSDEPVKNVAAIVITNHSDEMLQYGEIKFNVNDKDIALFKVTNLMPGCSALVLESGKREFSDKDDYTDGRVTTAYIPRPDLSKIDVEAELGDGEIMVTNNTDKDLSKVYVYYKYIQTGGAYMGGITYRVPVENIKKGKMETSIANHCSPGVSRIVDIQAE